MAEENVSANSINQRAKFFHYVRTIIMITLLFHNQTACFARMISFEFQKWEYLCKFQLSRFMGGEWWWVSLCVNQTGEWVRWGLQRNCVCKNYKKYTFLYPSFYNTLLNAFETRILVHIVIMVEGKFPKQEIALHIWTITKK